MNVTYIGLGNMGGQQATQIAKNNFNLTVFDVFAEAMEKFSGIARLASSPGDAAKGADVLEICVRDDQQVLDTLFGSTGAAEHLPQGSIVIVHSTIRLDTVKDISERLASKGIQFMDAPVSRTREDEEGRFVFTMTGGDPALTEKVRPVLETFSTDILNVGPIGAGMATKISNNLVTWVQFMVGSQAVKLASHFGVPFASLNAVMKANGNMTPSMEALLTGQQAVKPGDNPEFDAYMASQAGIGEKDLQVAVECGELAGLNMAMALQARELVRPVFERHDG
ncbi:NAD(P)-dependent oxidoreductase [Parahaliea maris]|uniref:NAD(P)-dependent oxidoreductase n=1 Tax=Parahaliea maris TaxID=2716870 RepID=A0A5C9A5Y5_9GAMM|nr:NAD(P)-dependent oxidoreductase [Parahaliea maris]TXS96106.1 NAD(P)-dependent oxidoreductase [Parahaliea maris]